MNNRKEIFCLWLVLALILAGCTGPGSAAPQGITEGTRARDFELQSLNGDPVALSDYRGSVVLVNLWATWCGPCRAEIPDFEAAYQARKDEGFVVLGVNLEESPETVEPFLAEFEVTYPVVLDERGQVMKEYRGRGLPMSFIVDREGVIQVRHMGLLTAGQLDDYLAKLLP